MKHIHFGVLISLFFLASCGIQSPWTHNKIRYIKHSTNETVATENPSPNVTVVTSHSTTRLNSDEIQILSEPNLIQKEPVIVHQETAVKPRLSIVISPKSSQKVRTIHSTKEKNEMVISQKKGQTISNNKSDTAMILELILCFLLPPLAVFLHEGKNWTNRCTINLILCLLFVIPGVLHALYVVLAT